MACMESHFGQKRSGFSRTVENFLGRSRIFSDGREFSRTIENFLRRLRVFSDGREFSRTVEILNFLRQLTAACLDISHRRSKIASAVLDRRMSIQKMLRKRIPLHPSWN